MSIRLFKYLSPFLLYYGALASFLSSGFVVWLPLIYAWFIIPLCELFIPANNANLSEAEEELAKKNKWYDVLLYLVVPCQYLALGLLVTGHVLNVSKCFVTAQKPVLLESSPNLASPKILSSSSMSGAASYLRLM